MIEEQKQPVEPPAGVDLSFTLSMLLTANADSEVRLLRCTGGLLFVALLLGLSIACKTMILWVVSLILIAMIIGFCVFELNRSIAKLKEMAVLRDELKQQLEQRIRWLEGAEVAEVEHRDSQQSGSRATVENLRSLLRMYESSKFRKS